MRRPSVTVVVAVALAACQHTSRSKPTEHDLERFVAQSAKHQSATELTLALQPSESLWNRIVVPLYRNARTDSLEALALAAADMAHHVIKPNAQIRARRHFAEDADLPAGAAHLRWALPVLFESYVVAIDGQTVDAVFVATNDGDGWRWHALGNIDTAIARAIATPTTPSRNECAKRVIASRRNRICLQLSVMATQNAFRGDDAGVEHACALVASQCSE
jgi:hypothetical protein